MTLGRLFQTESCAAWIARRPKPWVVVDWGILRALPVGTGLPGRFTAVLPPRLLEEVLGIDEGREGFLRKLEGILSHPDSRGRFLFGRDMESLIIDERASSDVRSEPIASIDFDLTTLLLERLRSESIFSEFRPSPADLGDRKESFVEMATKFGPRLVENQPGHLRELSRGKEFHARQVIEAREEMISLAAHVDPCYSTPKWKAVLREFPDRSAVGKWLRLVWWYTMHRAGAPGERIERYGNNFDDLHYAFAALYTGRIWTSDTGLRKAVLAVSGGRAVVDTDPRIAP